jgi:hypothetical protein
MDYKPKGKRDVGRPQTRWRGQPHLQDWVFTGQAQNEVQGKWFVPTSMQHYIGAVYWLWDSRLVQAVRKHQDQCDVQNHKEYI